MAISALHGLRAYLRLRPRVYHTLPRSIFGTLIGVTIGAWALTLYQAVSMDVPMGMAMRGGMAGDGMAGMAMDGMSGADWSLEGLAVFVALWTVMMVAMMLPGATPMILIFASAQARRERLVAIPTWIFIAGYFVIWAAAGLLVYLVVQVRDRACGSFCCARPGCLGAACARSNAGRRRAISVHAAQARMSPPLPLAACFCCSALARGTDRRVQDGNAPRSLLPRMLLGSFRSVSCGRNDEHRLDALAHAHRIRRKTISAGGPHFDNDRAGVYCSRTGHS